MNRFLHLPVEIVDVLSNDEIYNYLMKKLYSDETML